MKKIVAVWVFISFSISVFAQADSTKMEFEKVEVEAEFPGKTAGWTNYLRKNLNANVPVDNNAPIGYYTVVVRFIVSKTGKITEVVPETNHGYGMEKEVVRIIKTGPDWIPAIQDGRNVNAYRRQPVAFVVSEEGIRITTPRNLTAGKENIMLLNIDRVDNESIDLMIDNGTVSHEGGAKYKITPQNKGKVLMDIYISKNGKRKKRASAQFSVI